MPGAWHIVVGNSKSDWNPTRYLYLAPWLIFNFSMSMVSHIWVWSSKFIELMCSSSILLWGNLRFPVIFLSFSPSALSGHFKISPLLVQAHSDSRILFPSCIFPRATCHRTWRTQKSVAWVDLWKKSFWVWPAIQLCTWQRGKTIPASQLKQNKKQEWNQQSQGNSCHIPAKVSRIPRSLQLEEQPGFCH